ncbi:MAG: UDP-N-acetylmuramoyl-L-alanyl-D-glutamate--2,6-diaminopimelate ligase [Betaproteobacteria bacterium]|nr:UDP-N-acetylmuramoyl-L-alanyl-D-glutamate--2,6-diaminopimelate ligase [Betaproteobacteria bacterium]
MTRGGDVADFDVAALLARIAVRPQRITADSRAVEAGIAFAAFPGARVDGRSFIPDAVRRGAPAVFWEPAGFRFDAALAVPNAPVENLRHRLGAIADFIHGSPSRQLWMVGVTGTNGKTSCSQWIAQSLDRAGRRAGVVGTLGSGLVGALVPAPQTTPDAAVLQETLARLSREGARAVAMEVSSIGLDQGRVDGTKFDVALFTNLTRDHLDYHGTMAAYGAAKARLFAWPTLVAAVLNADDPFGADLARRLRGKGPRVLTYGLADADVRASSVRATARGTALDVETPWGKGAVEVAVTGSFNALNLLGTLGVLLGSEVPLADALAALQVLEPPPGRMQRLGGGDAPLCVVDYAHTPDALEKVLGALRAAVAPGRHLVCVFGCGGDRDPGKRPEMGRVAATLADRVVITSDNPRSEDPAAIAMAIAQGVRAAGNRHWRLEADRAKAIRVALADAAAGDVVLVAGKGHEDYQERGGERVPYSDLEEVRAALRERA